MDRILAILLFAGGVGYTLGVIHLYAAKPMEMLWALNTSGLIAVACLLNLLRSFRPTDGKLAVLSALACALVLADAVAFGWLIHNLWDPRAVGFAADAFLLMLFGLVPALRPKIKLLPLHMRIRPRRRKRTKPSPLSDSPDPQPDPQ